MSHTIIFEANQEPLAHADALDSIAESIGMIHRLLQSVRGLDSGEPLQQKASFVLLLHLSKYGPMRATELSEIMHSDISTVSRHLSKLVKDGYAFRSSDQSDGRSSMIEISNDGKCLCSQLHKMRQKLFSNAVKDWDAQTIEEFSEMLGRFSVNLTKLLNKEETYD